MALLVFQTRKPTKVRAIVLQPPSAQIISQKQPPKDSSRRLWPSNVIRVTGQDSQTEQDNQTVPSSYGGHDWGPETESAL